MLLLLLLLLLLLPPPPPPLLLLLLLPRRRLISRGRIQAEFSCFCCSFLLLLRFAELALSTPAPPELHMSALWFWWQHSCNRRWLCCRGCGAACSWLCRQYADAWVVICYNRTICGEWLYSIHEPSRSLVMAAALETCC